MGNPASNTDDCFREFIGLRVKGAVMLRDSRLLIFEDGRGLVVHHNGSFWVRSKEDVAREVSLRRRHLEDVQREMALPINPRTPFFAGQPSPLLGRSA